MNRHEDAEEILPAQGETCAVPDPSLLKRAALLFDRIWVPPPSTWNGGRCYLLIPEK